MQSAAKQGEEKRRGRELKFERVLNHSRAKVWAALTDKKALSVWLMPTDLEAKVGHRFTFQTDPAPGFDGVVNCEMLEVIPGERLRFTWVGGGVDTVVTFELSERDGETVLTLTQSGFAGVRARVVSMILAQGWRKILKRLLPNYLETAAAPTSSIRTNDQDTNEGEQA